MTTALLSFAASLVLGGLLIAAFSFANARRDARRCGSVACGAEAYLAALERGRR